MKKLTVALLMTVLALGLAIMTPVTRVHANTGDGAGCEEIDYWYCASTAPGGFTCTCGFADGGYPLCDCW
jgi:hypothetical protein